MVRIHAGQGFLQVVVAGFCSPFGLTGFDLFLVKDCGKLVVELSPAGCDE